MRNGSSERQGRGVYVALGSNMAYVAPDGATLSGAVLFKSVLLALRQSGVETLAASTLWSSPAWPDPNFAEYANVVVEVDPGSLSAQGLMRRLLQFETAYGRKRQNRWESRTLDLDIVDFRGEVLSEAGDVELTTPHPRAHERSFVMGPLREIAPEWRHPVLGGAVSDYLAASLDVWPARSVAPFSFSDEEDK